MACKHPKAIRLYKDIKRDFGGKPITVQVTCPDCGKKVGDKLKK